MEGWLLRSEGEEKRSMHRAAQAFGVGEYRISRIVPRRRAAVDLGPHEAELDLGTTNRNRTCI